MLLPKHQKTVVFFRKLGASTRDLRWVCLKQGSSAGAYNRGDLVLAGRAEVAGAANVCQRLEVAEHPREFLPRLHHPQIALRLVLIEGNGTIAHKGEDVMRVISKLVQQIAGFALLPTPPASWLRIRQRRSHGVLRGALINMMPR